MTQTEPEFDGPGLAASLKVTLETVGGLAAQVRRVARRLEAAPMQPVERAFPSSGIIPAGGFLVLNLGGPDQGHFWYVRSIVIGGATPATVCAGRADIFATATDLRNVPGVAQIGLNEWRDQATTLPLPAFYGRGELRVDAPADLYVVLSAATPAQAYTAIAYIEDYQAGVLTQTIEQ